MRDNALFRNDEAGLEMQPAAEQHPYLDTNSAVEQRHYVATKPESAGYHDKYVATKPELASE